MKNKTTTSQDSQERSAIMIEWGDLYGVWCFRCLEVTECFRVRDDIRCSRCNWKLAEKLDPDYAEMVKGGHHEGEVH